MDSDNSKPQPVQQIPAWKRDLHSRILLMEMIFAYNVQCPDYILLKEKFTGFINDWKLKFH